ncbi:MAG: O-antigen ligase family protein [Candidatus Brocadiia bacterium]
MLFRFELFLMSAAIVLRLLISGSTAGAGLNMVVGLMAWMALLLDFARKQNPSAEPPKAQGIPRIILALPLVFACLIVSGFFLASYKFGALPYGFAWITDIVLFYLVVRLNRPYLFLGVFAGTAALIACYGLYQHLWGLEALRQAIGQDAHLLDFIPPELRNNFLSRLNANEPFATFTYQNSLGGFLVLAIPIVMGLLSAKPFPRFGAVVNIAKVIIIGLMVWALWATGARGAWVAAVSAAVLFAALKAWPGLGRAARMAIVAVSVAGMVLAGLVFVYILTARQVPDSLNNVSPSLSIRYGYWRGVAEIIRHHPLGVGLNQFADNYLRYRATGAGVTQKAHNDFLQIGAETGVLGLMVFAAFFGAVLAAGLRRVISRPDGTADRIMLIGLISGLGGLLLHSMVDFNFYVPGLSMSAWLAAGCLVSLSYRGTESAGARAIDGRFARPAATIALLAVILFLSWLVCPRLLESESLLEQGRWLVRTQSGSADSIEKGRADLEQSRRLNPYSVEPCLELSWFYHRTVCAGKPDEFICINLLDRAIALSRLSSNLYVYQSVFFREHAEMFKSAGATDKAGVMLRQSELFFKKAAELNPQSGN